MDIPISGTTGYGIRWVRQRARHAGLRAVAGFLFVLVAAGMTASTQAQAPIPGRHTVVLENKAARLTIDLGGGSISDFRLQGLDLSPLHWGSEAPTPEPRPMGHFLCLDRWGQPSEAEQKHGMPFHGEAALVEWQSLRAPETGTPASEAEMTATLPLAGLRVKRWIRLLPDGACFVVREEVTNLNKLGRVYNMVQHATIGPPFLDERTVVDSNARRGLMQSSPLPNPEEPTVVWPEGRKDGIPVDIRHLTKDPDPNVVSYTIDEEYGWATACNPARGLMIGYFWRTTDYPWFSAWRHVEKGKPAARGLEFGTTGLHQPFPILLAKGRIFGRPLFEYLDADETRAKRYAGFLLKIPRNYHGVARVAYSKGRLTISERGGAPERDLTLEVGDLFPPDERAGSR